MLKSDSNQAIPRLDKLDFRILYELDKDASRSLSQIGKTLHVGRDVMHYRVKHLENAGVIRKYITVIDFSKIGYAVGAIYLKFRHESPELVTEVIKYYKKRNEVWWINEMEGNFDLAIEIFAKDIPSLRIVQRKLMEKYRRYIQDFKFRFFNRFFHYDRSYLFPTRTDSLSPGCKIIGSAAARATDKTDNAILRVLSENARLDYVSIAKKLGLSAAQVHYKIQKLRKEKIILGARPLLDLRKIGYEMYKLDIYLDDYSVYDDLLKFVSSHPNVIYAYDAFGGADLELDIEVKNYQEFRKLENTIKARFSRAIEKTEFIIFTGEHKLLYFPPE